MEAPARIVFQTEAPIPQHIENIWKYDESDSPPNPHTTGGSGGVTLGGGGGAEGLPSYTYIYTYIYIYTYSYTYIPTYTNTHIYI